MNSTEEYVNGLIERARKAQSIFEKNFTTQRAVDEVVRAFAVTIYNANEELSREAIEETGMMFVVLTYRKHHPLTD